MTVFDRIGSRMLDGVMNKCLSSLMNYEVCLIIRGLRFPFLRLRYPGVGKTSVYKLLAQNELKTVRILSRQFVTLESIRALTGESA
jgi:hypothetical protein